MIHSVSRLVKGPMVLTVPKYQAHNGTVSTMALKEMAMELQKALTKKVLTLLPP